MARREVCDIVVLGAGFGGSLLSLIARTAGRRVVLMERGSHPRFAIGESSTPLANLKLAALAGRYGLTAIKPLCKYGPWKRTYPKVGCGLKRGFSFFRHRRGGPFEPDPNHTNELLVAANPDAEHGDTHWYRADFDTLLVEWAQAAGVIYVDRCDIEEIHRDKPWHLRGKCADGPVEVTAPFLIDATGGSAPIAKTVGLRDLTRDMRTRTGGLYGHFRNVALWSDVLVELGGSLNDHPYPCDAAALHHVIDGGWMWVLRFDNGITSAGFSMDPDVYHEPEEPPTSDLWDVLLETYPSIGRQFRDAAPVNPLVRVRRLQRRWSAAAGEDWAMLPHTAGFVDPWLSTGIAHTLFGIERLARVVTDGWAAPERPRMLAEYDRSIARVFDLLDSLFAACMKSFDRFDILVSLTMAYFAAAIFSEERIRAGLDTPDDYYLLAHDQNYRRIVAELCDAAAVAASAEAGELARRTADLLALYNSAGLCDPKVCNMYPFHGTL